jgi:hypothetical protein
MLVIAAMTSGVATAKISQSHIMAEMPGSSLKWIHIAEVEFRREGLDLDKYRVSVIEEKNSVVVILTGLKSPKGVRGSMSPDPGYEVEISKRELKILHSNYVR